MDSRPALIVGRIDPVECIGVSQQRNRNLWGVKPPAMRLHDVSTPKNRRKIVYNQYKADLRDILKLSFGISVVNSRFNRFSAIYCGFPA